MTNTEPSSGRSPYAARKHDHHNPLAGGKVVPSKALAAAGEPSSETFLRGDDTWAEIPAAPVAAPVAGFDPNENPVIIGYGTSAGASGTPDTPALGPVGSVIIGQFASVNDQSQIAIGKSASVPDAATGIAIGASALASGEAGFGNGAIAIGDLAVASHADTLAIGTGGTTASGLASTAVGTGAIASGAESVALGNLSHASAQYAIAIGDHAVASVTDASAFGASASAAHSNATAIGAGAATTTTNQVMLGRTADTVVVKGSLKVPGLPTVNPGAGTGFVWLNSGVLTVA